MILALGLSGMSFMRFRKFFCISNCSEVSVLESESVSHSVVSDSWTVEKVLDVIGSGGKQVSNARAY